MEPQRNGQTINQGIVKKVIDSFPSLGIDETDIYKASLGIYKEHLETPFPRRRRSTTGKSRKLSSPRTLSQTT